ncbi:T9SS type A sorting domain-containing protein [Flavobacterium sp. NRK F7]|uniref:poly(ethylene terephthalate) hydrolase family protein n=1 Tax=Flavobacterium sp. NRK F7 TaxID=2954930 RepID=UPI002091B171|nr:T9SS type A sorting domain-containing protein [Flavobacterium sp. NRK F7]MCO6162250.1 T9SS type A sorting domain-containing protein [Flavobacterium sp. NRK F7]
MKNFLLIVIFLFVGAFEGITQNYNIASVSKNFRDSSRRNRSVSVKIYYPTNPVPNQPKVSFPVLVFGHGFVMGSDAYQNFYDNLVPKGYIVAFVNTENSVFANHDAYSKDLAFVVRAMQAENNVSSSVLNGIVGNKTALLGHSMGGGAAIVAASLAQVETVVTFAPAQLRFNTLVPASQVEEDAVVFSGSSDGVTPPDENHLPLYSNLGSNCKYYISITGGAHCYFANSNFACDFGERTASNNIQIDRTQQHLITFNFLNSWLDYKLKNNLVAQQTFRNDLATSNEVTFMNNCTQSLRNTVVNNEIFVNLYPNPASSHIAITLTNSEIFEKAQIYNDFGQLVVATTKDNIDVSLLKEGQYFVKIFTKESMYNKRLVIQK